MDCLWHLGIVLGRVGSDGQRRFHPLTPVDRGQFSATLHRMLDATGRADGLTEPRRPRFTDVPAQHTFDHEIHTLARVGVIEGRTATRFAAAQDVRRDQAASLLHRTAEWSTGADLEAVSNALFHDITGNVHRDAIEGAFEYGLVEGTRYPCGDGGGRYSPNRSLQRQQAASVLACAIATFDAIEAGEVERRQAEPECPTPVWLPRIETAATYAEQRSGSVSFAAIGTWPARGSPGRDPARS